MRLAWLRPSTDADAHPFDDTPALIRALGAEHHLKMFTELNAHDFVWQQFRAPFDVCVFELDNTAAHRFIWPYLLAYSGVLLLRTRTLHNSRAQALVHAGRLDDYVAEFGFDAGHPPHPGRGHDYIRSDDWPMLRVPLLASRVTAVTSRGLAHALQDEHPAANIRFASLPVRPLPENQIERDSRARDVVFGLVAHDRAEVARRAYAHARAGGAPAALLIDSADVVMQRADVILVLNWPGFGKPQTLALAAMASGKPVVVLETEASADWPMLDPQTWRARGLSTAAPVGVSVDLRDEEHSLSLAIRRLATDIALRHRLGEAGRLWWREHATVDSALNRWREVLREAASRDRPPEPADWPAHLNADGTQRAREILAEFGVTSDLFADVKAFGQRLARGSGLPPVDPRQPER